MAKPPQTLHIREATLADTNSIYTILHTEFLRTFGHQAPKEDTEAYMSVHITPTAIASEIADPLKTYAVACDPSGEILGFAILIQGTSEPFLSEYPDLIEVNRLYVSKDAQGKGVGRALMEEAQAWAMGWGRKHMWLGVFEDNHRALRAYEKWGWRVVGSHDFVVGRQVDTDLVMIKAL